MSKLRIQKILSQAGLLSRRAAEKAIESGRVKINGNVITELGVKADPTTDLIELDHQKVILDKKKEFLLFHKPIQCLTTKHDPHGRKTIYDWIPKKYHHLNPVGRLDYESEGLLLLTNDGDLGNRLMHPSFGVRKTYEVHLDKELDEVDRHHLLSQILLEDGPGHFEGLHTLSKKVYEVEVSEGRNRFVRRMFQNQGYEVLKLKRIEQGPLELSHLASGEFRILSEKEVTDLDQMIPKKKS
ncbi:MAG: pseudouridine synthase [Bdellovibrionaceae bacterium]|nr:pseudouridine synthase [Pseudobdellovibrionaceae bacterium]|tara:strand:+ start:2225 stop:2947 length:723 start_codon:yes stop_codon:yes gene_type:complete